MAKRPLPEVRDVPFKRRRIVTPSTLSNILKDSSAATQRTLPSAACISNVLSQESQDDLNTQLSRVLNSGKEPKTRNQIQQSESHLVRPLCKWNVQETEKTENETVKDTPFLPSELWIQIFSYLSDYDKWNLAQTSTRFYFLFRTFVGYEYLVIFQSELEPLESVRDPIVSEEIIETDQYTIQTLDDLRVIGHAQAEGYVLHWRGSLTCLILYHPTESASADAARVWTQYFRNTGLTIGDQHYLTNQIPEWCTTGAKVLAVVPLGENDELLLRYNRHKLDKKSKHLKLAFIFNPNNKIKVQLKVYCKEVNAAVANGVVLPENVQFILLDMLQEEMRLRGVYMSWNSASITLSDSTAPAIQPVAVNIDLFEYQRKGLNWMTLVEESVSMQHSFRRLTPAPGFPALNFYLETGPFEEPFSDIANFRPVKDLDVMVNNSTDSFSIRGGMFADEMGMGKTITILSLIATHKRRKSFDRYIPIGRSEALYEISSTLVICPSHIVAQWKAELLEHVPSLSVLDITVFGQLRALTYQDIIDTDVIIISHQFLQNRSYVKKIGKLSTIHQRSLNNRKKFLRSTHTPVLQHFGWHRIVLDEGHEILSRSNPHVNAFSSQESCGKELFDSFLSNYRWYVTGTPLPRGRASLVGALNFLQIHFASGVELPEKLEANSPTIAYEFAVFNKFKENLFWRNTKRSTNTQIEIPHILEEVRLLEFSPIEQAMYEAAEIGENIPLMRQICTLPTQCSMGENLSLTEIKAKMNCKYSRDLGETWEQLLQYQEKLNGLEKDLIYDLRFLMTLAPHLDQYQQVVARIDRTKAAMASMRSNILLIEKRIVKLISQTACFTRLSVNEDLCAFCEQELPPVCVKALCRHLFCSGCFERVLVQSARCPVCSVYLKSQIGDCIQSPGYANNNFSELVSRDVSMTTNLRVPQRKIHFQQLVNHFGTKIASLLAYVKDLLTVSPDGKIIVFSKWDSLLQYLGDAFQSDTEDLRDIYAVCRGTVQARKKALERFCDTSPGSPSILLLSLNHAASGTHLTLATHIILVDPVAGTKEEALAIDAQALARAHRLGQTKPVTAIRFIIHSTIDQEDFENTFPSIDLNPCVPTFSPL